jgi:hypothetical protein
MRKEPTTTPSRREFLVRCAQLAVALRAGIGALARVQSAEPSPGFGRQELKLLAAAMDEIIPQSDEMPSASAAGGVAYLEQLGWQYANVLEEIGNFLREVQQTSQKTFGIEFGALAQDRRV